MTARRTIVRVVDAEWGVYPRTGVVVGDEAHLWCSVVHQNILEDDAWVPEARDAIAGDRLMVWTGALGDALFERAPETWMPEGMARLHAWLDRASAAVGGAGARLLVRPHARHVLCDAHRTVSFLTEREDVGLALAPAALIESDMLTEARDHYVRTLETLAERCSILILQNVKPPETVSAAVRRTPVRDGLLDPEDLIDLALAYLPSETPIMVRGADVDLADRLRGA